jgi:hypothetical protein
VAVVTQVARRERTIQMMERVIRVRRSDEAHSPQRLARGANRCAGCDGQVRRALRQQRLCRSTQHGLEDFDARAGTDHGETLEASEEEPRGEQDLDGHANLGFPSSRDLLRCAFEIDRLLEEHAGATIQELAHGRQERFAPPDLERAHRQEGLELLHRIRHRRLALVERLRRLRVAASVDDHQERPPLFEGDVRSWAHALPE